MTSEPSYLHDFDAITPEKEYRRYIDKLLSKKTASSSIKTKKKLSRRSVEITKNPFKDPTPVNIPVAKKERHFIRRDKYIDSINDAIDNFLAMCERSGLDKNKVTASRIENACLSEDSSFLPDELIKIIIENNEIKEAISDLSFIIRLNKQVLIDGKKLSASPAELTRHAERARRFYRAGANIYSEKLHELEESVDALKEMSISDLEQLNGDIKKIADAVAAIAERIAKEMRRRDAQAGAIEKLAKDPKQAAKQRVKECWILWKSEPSRYKSKAAFAKDMLNKFEDLESQPVIERWCRDWSSEVS